MFHRVQSYLLIYLKSCTNVSLITLHLGLSWGNSGETMSEWGAYSVNSKLIETSNQFEKLDWNNQRTIVPEFFLIGYVTITYFNLHIDILKA